MPRAAAAVLLLSAAFAATAGPIPPPSEKELIARHWGKTEGEGLFELKGGRLTLGLAGVSGSGELRVDRTVRGDFTAEVRVAADAPDPTKDDARAPASSAGLLVTGGASSMRHYLWQVYHRHDGKLQETPQRSVWTDRVTEGAGGGTALGDVEAGHAVSLRVARTSGQVSVSFSLDGKTWDGPRTFADKLNFPDEVTVGLFVSQTTRQKLHATFEKFVIEKPKEK